MNHLPANLSLFKPEFIVRVVRAVKTLTSAVIGFCLSTTLQAQTVGTTPGQFSVDQGVASYTVPIAVPPGVAGMEPSLGLQVSSPGSNGVAGLGGGLTGLSVISRCPATIAQDGFRGGIHFDDSDRYCLDGQRLIAIRGANGRDGSEYRTELDTLSKIVAHGSEGSGPRWFEVWTKAGQRLEYGNSHDSRVTLGERTDVMTWTINRMEDAVGNVITVAYHADNAAGEHYPLAIRYAGNVIRFDYKARPDSFSGYQLGTPVQMTQRLAKVTVSAQGEAVREYRLNYHPADTATPSRLAAVQLCAGNGDCLQPVEFAWSALDAYGYELEHYEINYQGRTISYPRTQRGTNEFNARTWTEQYGREVGDINGDAILDIVGFYKDGVHIALGEGDGQFGSVNVSPYFKTTNGALSATTGWGARDREKNAYYPRLLGDVNGDGKTDVVGVGRTAVYVGLGSGRGIAKPVAYLQQQSAGYAGGHYDPMASWGGWEPPLLPGGFAPHRDVTALADIDGDARADLVAFVNDGVYVAYSQGDSFSPFVRQTTAFSGKDGWDHDHHPRFVADLNSDGKSDLIGFASSGTYVALSTGTGFINKGKVLTGFGKDRYHNTYDYPRTLADVNGDGAVDIVGFAAGGVEVALGKGDGNFQVLGNSYAGGVTAATPVLADFGYAQGWRGEKHVRTLADVNGDGRSDVVGFKDDGVYVALAKPLSANTHTASIYGREYTYQTHALFNNKIHQLRAFGYRAGGWRVDKHPRLVVDVDGNGSADILGFSNGGVEVATNRFNGQLPSLVAITDGFGNTTEISYAPLQDREVYAPQSDGSYPILDLIGGPQYLVSEIRADNGFGGQLSTRYRYGGLKAHLQGRGSLGFAWTETEQVTSGKVSRTEYRQDFPFVGLVKLTRQRVAGQRVKETSSSYQARNQWRDNVWFPYLSRNVEKTWELGGHRISTVIRENGDLDAYGNVGTVTVITEGGGQRFAQTTRNSYRNNTDRWHLGRLLESTVTHDGYGHSQTRHSRFRYNSDTGLLMEEVIEPDHANALTTRYRHDRFGNTVEVSVSGQGLKGRTTRTGYDAQGRFATTSTNALGHSENHRYDARFGVMTRLTGPNQLTTEWAFDRFGRKIRETRADGTATRWARSWAQDCEAAHPQAVWCLTEESDGTGLSSTQFGKLGRQVRRVTTGFDGRYALVDREYDKRGREVRVSQPYFDGDPLHWTQTRYDDLDRVVEVKTEGPEGYPITVQTTYNGLNTTVTNPKGETKTTTTDVLGRVVQVTEPQGATVEYTYDALGNLLQTRDPEGHTTTLVYDQRGHKVAMEDPAMGHWEYAYNAAGELIWQKDAKGQEVKLHYDALGRLLKREEREGISQWLYDTAARGVGKLAQVIGSDGFKRSQTYDRLGRPRETVTEADGKTLKLSTEYDGLGRVTAVNYPMGFRVERDYNDHGYLLAVKSPKGLIQDYQRRHVEGLLGEALLRIEVAQGKAANYQAEAARYRTKARQYQGIVDHYSSRATTKRQQSAALRQAANRNDAKAAREMRAASVDQAAVEREQATVAGINAYANNLRQAADNNQASADRKHRQAQTLDRQAATLERQALEARAAGYLQYGEAWKDSVVAVQLRAASARLNVIAAKLETQARYWQAQANMRYATLKRIGGGVRCFTLWGGSFCIDFGAVLRKAATSAANNARHYIKQAKGYRQQAAVKQAQAHHKTSEAGRHWRNGTALLSQSRSQQRQASAKRQRADNLQAQAASQKRLAQQQDNSARHYEQIAAPTNEKVTHLQAQADQHRANAKTAKDTAERQRAQAQQKLAAAVPLDQKAKHYLALVNRELSKAETAVTLAERYAKEVRELEAVASNYRAVLGDEDYAVFWRAQARDAAGRLNRVVHGNGLTTRWRYNQATGTLDHLETGLLWDSLRELEYQYDNNSNVTRRSDLANDITETFQYDSLDRLSYSSVSSDTETTEAYNNRIDYAYDLSGNITYKSDVGHYRYDSLKPYSLVSAGSRHTHYRYDANGNVTRGGGRTFTWSSFNKPTRMTKGGASASFHYDPARNRYKRVDNLDGRTTTTLYLGKSYEEITTGDRTTHKYFIYAGNQLAAIHFDEVDRAGNQGDYQTRYLHTDALGSVDLITDGAGQVVDKLSFDPFGKRRSATWRSVEENINPSALAPRLTNRGFTGHEHVDAIGIIHMNGRIYDPELGRFLSADPTMQHPYSTQGQNRYAYVQNNPLKYVDMNGFGFFSKLWKGIKKVFKKIVKGVRRLIIPVVAAVVGFMVCGPQCAIAAFRGAYAAQEAYRNGASLKHALLAGFLEGVESYYGYKAGGGTLQAMSFGANIETSSNKQIEDSGMGSWGNVFLAWGQGRAKELAANDAERKQHTASSVAGGTGYNNRKSTNGAMAGSFAYAQGMKIAQQTRSPNPIGRAAAAAQANRDPNAVGIGDFFELLGENAKRVLTLDLGVEAAYGPGGAVQGQTNLNGDARYTVTYSKGIILKPVGSLSAEIYSSGEINGFFQALEFCAVGCIDLKWNYVDFSIGTSIGPNAGFSFKSGVTNRVGE